MNKTYTPEEVLALIRDQLNARPTDNNEIYYTVVGIVSAAFARAEKKFKRVQPEELRVPLPKMTCSHEGAAPGETCEHCGQVQNPVVSNLPEGRPVLSHNEALSLVYKKCEKSPDEIHSFHEVSGYCCFCGYHKSACRNENR